MRLCWGGLHVEGGVKGCKLHVMPGVWGQSVVAQHVVEHTQQTLDTLLAHTASWCMLFYKEYDQSEQV